jgi:hypothetical protein
MKEIEKIHSALKSRWIEPVNNEKLDLLTAELDKIHATKDFWKSEWAKSVLSLVKYNSTNALMRLLKVAKWKPTLEELLSCAFDYESNIALVSSLTGESEVKVIEWMIDDTLKELYNLR